jgi:hypothetical protein
MLRPHSGGAPRASPGQAHRHARCTHLLRCGAVWHGPTHANDEDRAPLAHCCVLPTMNALPGPPLMQLLRSHKMYVLWQARLQARPPLGNHCLCILDYAVHLLHCILQVVYCPLLGGDSYLPVPPADMRPQRRVHQSSAQQAQPYASELLMCVCVCRWWRKAPQELPCPATGLAGLLDAARAESMLAHRMVSTQGLRRLCGNPSLVGMGLLLP